MVYGILLFTKTHYCQSQMLAGSTNSHDHCGVKTGGAQNNIVVFSSALWSWLLLRWLLVGGRRSKLNHCCPLLLLLLLL